MKRLFFKSALIVSVLGLVAGDVWPQNPTLAGFVFVNGISINERADITANGRKLTNKGIVAGNATSGLGLQVGSYQVQVTAPGCVAANAQLQIAVGATPILTAYRERKIDPITKKPVDSIKLLQFAAAPDPHKYLLTAVSLDPAVSFTATGGGQTQKLDFAKPVNFQAKTLKVNDSTGSSAESEVDEQGSYFCFLFHKADGKVGIIVVPQTIYQW